MPVPKRRYPPNNVKAKPKPCIDCVREAEESGLPVKKRKAPHPGPRCSSHARIKKALRRDNSWETRLKAIYGITADEYWEIYEAQGGRCYICRRGTGARKRLSVDHCHETGVIRGLLDTPCNRNVLGYLRDEIEALERAIAYLKNPPAVAVLGERIAPIEADRLDLTLDGE